MIIRKEPFYDFTGLTFGESLSAEFLQEKFYLAFPIPKASYLKSLTEDTALLEIPGALTLRVINRSYTDEAAQIDSMRKEGCFYFNEEKEWILEAVCTMCTSDGTFSDVYTLRLPLSVPFAGEGEVGLYFDGTWLRFMKDGRVLNENSGLDCFTNPLGEPMTADGWQNAFRVGKAEQVPLTYTDEEETGNADFYSPAAWNAFAGDVMNFYHDGVYHLIYLRDRRHHGSRNRNGAHDIYQLTSKDLVHWSEQEPVAVIDEPWKSYGTGTMLFHQGKYYMVYGFHTERYQGAQEQVQSELDEEKQEFKRMSCEQLLAEGKLPAGASYSVSEDGIHFVPSGMLYHPGRNPSTYAMPDGKVRVYAGYMGDGIWEADSMESPFHKTEEDFSFVDRSVMKNTTECPSFFEWNGYKYLVIGFTGYYRTLSTDSSQYVDMAGKEEIYDGLCVPMVTSWKDDRKLIAGWLHGIGWGSVIVHRELIQEEGGKLGLKWVPELVPETAGENLWIAQEESSLVVPQTVGAGYLLEFTVDPKQASRMGIQFAKEEKACELQLDFGKKRMQMMETASGVLADSIPTSYEVAKEIGEEFEWRKPEAVAWHLANNTTDFCIADIQGMEQPFTVKILLRYSRKLRSTVIDAEVAGRRTMISVRADFFPDTVSLLADGEIDATDLSMKKLSLPIA